MLERQKVIDSEEIKNLFGIGSTIYAESIDFLEKEAKANESFQAKFELWNIQFRDLYGKDLKKRLFLTQTYYSTLLKIISVIKYSIIQSLSIEATYTHYISNDIKPSLILEFHFFDWMSFDIGIFKKIFKILEDIQFAHQDLFITLYQQLILSSTRHKIGEFYTPVILAQKMVNYVYNLGEKVLDPSCGSGNFLVEIILKILKSDLSLKLKIKAINNVYGFDINPLAILTTRVNLFLLMLEHIDYREIRLPDLNIILIDSLFPEHYEDSLSINLNSWGNSFDLIIGNPPWLTYKDLRERNYQDKLRELTEELQIKPLSQYITHIELAAVFFYAIPLKFLKVGGNIFFVITKSVLNGDHCEKFRVFSVFDDLEIWDFPNYYFFNIEYICLKAKYIGKDNNTRISDKYPIKTKILDNNLVIQEELNYSSLKLENDKAKSILPEYELNILKRISYSSYKEKFFQGATLVPRSLIFFLINEYDNGMLKISSDPDILSRTKKNWIYYFEGKQVEQLFHFKTLLNKDLIPFHIKRLRDIFLPINQENFEFNLDHLKRYPNAYKFYNEVNKFYKSKKKTTSNIHNLYDNLNYWDKLAKQVKNRGFLVIYNASGSYLKASVINNEQQKLIIGSENYYFATDSKSEAYFLSAILNSPLLSKNIKLIKSSRHIHKRPFSFPIPLFDRSDELHLILSRKAIKCESIVQDLYIKNPNINSAKVRILINYKLKTLNILVEKVVFKEKK